MNHTMPPPERIEVIDALRGQAASAVVLYRFVGFISHCGVAVGSVGALLVAAILGGVWLRAGSNCSEAAAWTAVAVACFCAVRFAAIFYRVVELRAVTWSRAVRIGPVRLSMMTKDKSNS